MCQLEIVWCLTLHILYSIIFKNQEVNKVCPFYLSGCWILALNNHAIHKQPINYLTQVKVLPIFPNLKLLKSIYKQIINKFRYCNIKITWNVRIPSY